MERPTKPVIWTDEEATQRFIDWAQENHSRWYEATMSLMDSEKLPIMHTNSDYFNHFVGLVTQDLLEL